MKEFPFQLIVKRSSLNEGKESLLCTDLFRTIPGRRAIYDAMWNDKSVVAKVFSHKIHARRHLRKEWQGLIQLQKLGLSSPKPLFYGRTEDGQWIIVLEKIAESATILDVLNEIAEKQKEIDLLIRVYRELAKQHSKGIFQKDLHLGNFLMAGNRIYTLDPSKMRFLRHQVPRKKSIFQLALLLCCLPTSDIRTTRVICEEYFNARGWHFDKSDEALLKKQMVLYRRKGIRRALKKSLRTSRKYLKITNKQYSAVFEKGFCRESEALEFIEQLDVLMDSGQILKKGDSIYVSHIIWNNKNIVVKRYDHKGFIHSLRHTIKKSRARRGWLHGHRLRMLNISTPKPLAYIEQRKGLLIWQSYLITEYVEGQKLWHFLRDDNVTEGQKLEGIRQVVKLLDKLWKSRITHGDLKHTNILITKKGSVLSDLDGMMVHRWELLYRNKQAKDVERFLRKTNISPALISYCKLLISSARDSCKKLPEGFEKMQIDKWTICARKDFPKYYIGNIVLKNYLSYENNELFTRVPSSEHADVFKYSISLDTVGRLFYLKKYLYRSRIDFAKHLFRPSRARRAFNATLMLLKNGFDTPAVMGLFENHTGPFCTDNLLLTDEVKSSKTLAQLLNEMCQNPGRNSFTQKRVLVEAFGRIIGRLHAKGIFHGDLRLGNVLVVREEQKWRLFFIDNERTKQFSRLPDGLRLKNLVQINMFRNGITNSDRLRFFKAYLKNNPEVANNQRDWTERILTKTSFRLQNKKKVF